ncbi:MAG TPA: hypothetical protein VM939_08735 [Gemmatimonadaceae bacterium]|nr:hypothetical protein [Gemmatimonadaceae bacterium]
MTITIDPANAARTVSVFFCFVTSLLACVEPGSETAKPDSTVLSRSAPVVTSARVNQGTYGMRSTIKWMFSPDSSAILVMVDPVGVENEPVPNGFFYGSESRNFQTRMDGIWDVAPSPDWGTIAFSRAHVVSGRGEDSIPPALWTDLARRTGMDTATLINGSFASSAMALAKSIAQPGLIQVPVDPRSSSAAEFATPRVFQITRGWRLRWTADGGMVALGNNPARADDNEDSESWAALDAKSGGFHGTLPEGAKLVAPRWIAGPTLEMSVPVDMQGARAITIASGNRTFAIESSRGVITARETTAGGNAASAPYSIGSGKALAATKGGKYILALAPRGNAVGNEVPVEAVVYIVGW